MSRFFKQMVKMSLLSTTIMSSNFFCKQKKRKVYIWGNGIYQARPQTPMQFLNFQPKLITNLPPNLNILAFGPFYEAGIDTSNRLYVWDKQTLDANLCPQLKTHDSTRQNIKMISKDIKDVKFMADTMWALTTKGQLLKYPLDAKNRLQGGKQVPKIKNIVQIATGHEHVVLLDSTGNVFAMGDDTYGQCGLFDKQPRQQPFPVRKVTEFIQVPISNITKIAANGCFTLALDQTKHLYGWGSNNLLQLSQDEAYSKAYQPLVAAFNPVPFEKDLHNEEIQGMVACEQSTFILTKSKKYNGYNLFAVGHNTFGQLGIGDYCHIKDITKVEKLSGLDVELETLVREPVKIEMMACGNNHCVCKLNIRQVLIWGANEAGEQGNKKRSPNMGPAWMKLFEKKNVVGVFAGHTSTGVIVQAQE